MKRLFLIAAAALFLTGCTGFFSCNGLFGCDGDVGKANPYTCTAEQAAASFGRLRLGLPSGLEGTCFPQEGYYLFVTDNAAYLSVAAVIAGGSYAGAFTAGEFTAAGYAMFAAEEEMTAHEDYFEFRARAVVKAGEETAYVVYNYVSSTPQSRLYAMLGQVFCL